MEVTAVTCRMCPCSFLSLGNHGIGFGYLPKKGKCGESVGHKVASWASACWGGCEGWKRVFTVCLGFPSRFVGWACAWSVQAKVWQESSTTLGLTVAGTCGEL